MQKPLVDIISVVISKPLLVGIYENNILVEEIKRDGLTSNILPEIFYELLEKYDINSIIYSKGPGSYMSIKLAYVFFKTLEISKNIKLLATDGFYFNNNSPIKAVGNSYFIKKEGIITIKKDLNEGEFFLPKKLNKNDFSEEIEPLYVLKAV